MKKLLLLLAAVSALAAEDRTAPGAREGDRTAPVAREGDRTAWFREAKFGMFIHWGPYSLASVEASWPIMRPGAKSYPPISETDYRALPQRFNPVRFDARAWVRLAKAAGQRYMVFTSKHHDGFSMFDSAYTNYKIANTPYKKDIVAELAAAAKAEAMPLGFYYSPPDMNHPGFRDTSKPASENWGGEPARAEWPLYLDYMQLQITELLTRYGDVAILWFDGLGGQQKYDGRRFHKLIRELQPACLINNRIGLDGDYQTPEQVIPKTIPSPEKFRLWETCMTINRTWAYNKHDSNYKSVTQLIRALVEIASKGGNFLLNVGPTPEGTIQPEFEERLLGIGAWLKVNGESIYGTTYGPLPNTTAKGGTVYLHVFDWPKGELDLVGLSQKVREVTLLADGKKLPFRRQGDRLTIQLPAAAPDP
ncbi:MAG: alpha-L-fucosidase, partial [Acidobacteriota bacterium]